MTRAVAARIRRLEGRFGWQLTPLTHASGAELTVPSLVLIDAWLRVVLDGHAPGLPERTERFLCGVVPGRDTGEVVAALRKVCRETWPSEDR
jgi:hypothetical protein